MRKREVSIIGIGALGSVLAQALADAGLKMASLYNHHEKKAAKLAAVVQASKTGVFPQKKSGVGEMVFLTVPDRYIQEIATQLAAIDNDFSGYVIIHCSGNKSSAVLEPLRRKGAVCASFHPLQTFTRASTPADFKGICVDIEGDEPAVHCLQDIGSKLGCDVMKITAKAKPFLHAAAVVASNYMVALIVNACGIAQMGGIDKDDARRALMPLVEKSVENISTSDRLSDALSGPIVRGDTTTIANHTKLLEQNPRLLALYKHLGGILVELAEEDDLLSREQLNEIAKLFDE